MNVINKIIRPYGLRARFVASILIYGVVCAVVFYALSYAGEYAIDSFIEDPDALTRYMERCIDDLQEYIDKEELSSADLEKLRRWEKRKPLVILKIYDKDEALYSSYYEIGYKSKNNIRAIFDQSYTNSRFPLKFSDKKLSAVMYIDVVHKRYAIVNAAAFAIAAFLFILLFLRGSSRRIRYIIRLDEDVRIIEGGDLDHEVAVEGNDELTSLAKRMNGMRASFQNQLDIEHELRQAHSKLISEMSHDLRTPLTGLMLYTEILSSGKYSSDAELKKYLDKIDEKAKLMKRLSDNIFEYATESRTKAEVEPMDLRKALYETMAGIIDELELSGFRVQNDMQWEALSIDVRQDSLGRIAENLVSNIKKYASADEPVHIDAVCSDRYAGFSLRNALSEAKNAADVDSHGIGLESVRSMMKQMGGICSVEKTDDTFQVTVLFRRDDMKW